MTTEQAIFTIKHRNGIMNYGETGQLAAALDIAIAALEAELCEVTWVTNNKGEGVAFKDMPIEKVNKILAIMDDEPCEDAVSREAVLRINELHHGQMPNHINHQIWEEVKALPPVTPKPTECEEAVSRETVLKAFEELPHEYKTKEQRARTGGIAACQAIVRELPSVTPKQRTGNDPFMDEKRPNLKEVMPNER